MQVSCENCGTHYQISPQDIAQGGGCPTCGHERFYRDQPSPLDSEMAQRDMVDSISQKDQGGNPLGEGTIMGRDGERPLIKRDNFMHGKTAGEWDNIDFGEGGPEPTHHFIVTQAGRVHSLPSPVHHEDIANANGLMREGYPQGMSLGVLNNDGSTEWYQHDSPWQPQQLQQALQTHFNVPVMVDPNLPSTSNEQRWGLTPGQAPGGPRRELDRLYGPAAPRSWGTPKDNEGLVRGGSVERSLNMEPYPALWSREADVGFAGGPDQNLYPEPQYSAIVTPGPYGIHAGTTKWLRFLRAHVNGIPAHQNASEIVSRYGFRNSPEFGQPVTVAVHHPSHLPAAIETIQQSADGSRATPTMRQVGQAIQRGELPPPPGIDIGQIAPAPQQQVQEQPQEATAHTAAALVEGAPLAVEGLGEAGAALGVPGAADVATGAGDVASGIWNGAKDFLGGIFGGGGKKAVGQIASPLMNKVKAQLPGAVGGGLATQGLDAAGMGPGGSAGPAPVPGDTGGLSSPALPYPLLASLVTGDYSTPSSVPEVGTLHDDPEKVDQHEFNDQDRSPNQYNPNLQDSGSSGEDAVRQNGGFAPDSPALERMQLLSPLLLHYYNSPEDGFQDPLIRGLHEALESENPGYLDQAKPEHIQHLDAAIQHHRQNQTHGVHAKTAGPMGFGVGGPGLQGLMQGQTPQGIPGTPEQGRCPYCGGTTTADGSCPQCGARSAPQGGAVIPGQVPGGRASLPPGTASIRDGDLIYDFSEHAAANHQGPVTPEQQAAVAQLLIREHRAQEIPDMLQSPFQYARELALVQQDVDMPPPAVDPSQATPPQPQMQAPGAMPMPGMGGEPGGAPMSPMAHVAADNVAQRCPKCHSATTGTLNDEGESFCHACGNIWKMDNIIKDNLTTKDSSRVAEEQPHHPNVPAAPIAEQHGQRDIRQEQDSSLTWKDSGGQPLQVNQEYEMHNPSYRVPDIVKIKQIKPDGLVVQIQGEYSNDPDALAATVPISKEEADIEKLTFIPSDGGPQDADDRNDQAPDGSTPGYQQVPPSGQTTDEHDNSYPGIQSSVQDIPEPIDDDTCPACGSLHTQSSMSSPTTVMHDCFRCGKVWETVDEWEGKTASGADLSWVMTDDGPGGDDFWSEYARAQEMRKAGTSRSLSDIAAKDARSQAIKDRLDAAHMARTAGRKLTPREQRELIEENGVARNSDLLDLEGTHYKTRGDYTGKANGMNVPDEHLLLGV